MVRLSDNNQLSMDHVREAVRQWATTVATRAYNMDVQLYSGNEYVPVAKNCFAFMFTNVGDTIARVNGMVIFPSATPLTSLGDSRTVSGHEGDIYTGTIVLSFNPTVTNPSVELVQLFYI